MNIYEKMSEITAEIAAVAKNLNVGYGRSQYKAVGEADVLAAVKPIEKKYKIYSYPVSRNIIESGVMTSVKNDGTEIRQNYLRIETVYRFVDVEKPEDYIDITTYGDGVDAQDKAPGKAMTYGDKYALLKAYKIITGDDPDQSASNSMVRMSSKQPVKQEPPKVNPAPPKVNPEDRIDETHWKAFQKTIREHGIHPQWVMDRYQIKPSEITYQMEHDIVMELPELAKEYMAERQTAEEAGHDGQTA